MDGDKENEKGCANDRAPSSPGGLSMRHKIKQSFTNLASLLTPKEGKSVLRRSSPLSRTPEPEREVAATIPLPESPRSETPVSEPSSSPAKSPGRNIRRFLPFSLSPDSKFKMDSKTAEMLRETTTPTTGEEDQQKDVATPAAVDVKGKGRARDEVEPKSPASIKDMVGLLPAPSTVPPTIPSPSTEASPSRGAGQENRLTAAASPTTTTDKGKGSKKQKTKKKKGKKAAPEATVTASTPSPPPTAVAAPAAPAFAATTLLPGSVDDLTASESQGDSDLTSQITALLGRLQAGETIDYQLRNPPGYVDEDPDCLDFLNDPECQEILGNTTPGPSSTSGHKGRKGKR
ncbi:hypothetical protein TWF730_009612 [Orbilia blumenaviensis]|uniref:Uncharacterized protein n=1 Tax=Orbilia blumenaviensis TaxID=1796055 RepID=A0AAV9UUS7_9PEZI